MTNPRKRLAQIDVLLKRFAELERAWGKLQSAVWRLWAERELLAATIAVEPQRPRKKR